MGGGWRPPGPIADPKAPPQFPHFAPEGWGRREQAAPCLVCAALGRRLGTTTPDRPCCRAGVRVGTEGAAGESADSPGDLPRVPLGFHGDSRRFTKHWLLDKLIRCMGPQEGYEADRLPSSCRTPPEGLKQCPAASPGRCRPGRSLQVPATTQSDAFEEGTPRDSRMQRAEAVIMGNCSHLQSGRPLRATYVCIFPLLWPQPEFTLGGAELGLLQPELSGSAAVLTPLIQGMVKPLEMCNNSIYIYFTCFLHV